MTMGNKLDRLGTLSFKENSLWSIHICLLTYSIAILLAIILIAFPSITNTILVNIRLVLKGKHQINSVWDLTIWNQPNINFQWFKVRLFCVSLLTFMLIDWRLKEVYLMHNLTEWLCLVFLNYPIMCHRDMF